MGPLYDIHRSLSYDPTELQVLSATDTLFIVFIGSYGALVKVSDPLVYPGDPAGTLRTIQFGASPGQYGNAGPTTLITTATFQVIGGTDGIADIDVIELNGDVMGGGRIEIWNNTSVSYAPVPEPGTVLLLDLGVAGLGYSSRRETWTGS